MRRTPQVIPSLSAMSTVMAHPISSLEHMERILSPAQFTRYSADAREDGSSWTTLSLHTQYHLFEFGGGTAVNGFRLDGISPGDQAGWAVATGDVNGDGKSDIIIGAPQATGSGQGSNDGSVYVVFGAAGGWPTTMSLSTLNGTNGFELDGVNVGMSLVQAGASVAAGDINGDGKADIIIGVPHHLLVLVPIPA